MKSKFSLFFVLMTLLVSAFNVGALTATSENYFDNVDVKEMEVYVKGDLVWYGVCTRPDSSNGGKWYCETYQYNEPSIERGETISVKTIFKSNVDHEEVKVKTWINGYKEDIEDETSLFDMFAGYSYVKTLYLEIPEDIDATEDYTLHVEIMDGVFIVTGSKDDKRNKRIRRIMEKGLGKQRAVFGGATPVYVDDIRDMPRIGMHASELREFFPMESDVVQYRGMLAEQAVDNPMGTGIPLQLLKDAVKEVTGNEFPMEVEEPVDGEIPLIDLNDAIGDYGQFFTYFGDDLTDEQIASIKAYVCNNLGSKSKIMKNKGVKIRKFS